MAEKSPYLGGVSTRLLRPQVGALLLFQGSFERLPVQILISHHSEPRKELFLIIVGAVLDSGAEMQDNRLGHVL